MNDDSNKVINEMGEPQTLKVLLVASAPLVRQADDGPVALQSYDFSEETARLQAIFGKNDIAFTLLPDATVDTFHSELIGGKYDVVHFSGHGDEEGCLWFEDAAGALHVVPPQRFADLLNVAGVKLAFLSACYSEVCAEQVKYKVPAVVAVISRAAIEPHAAALFAEKFYAALVQGNTLTKAVQTGKAAVAADHAVGDHVAPRDQEGSWSERFTHKCTADIALIGSFDEASTSKGALAPTPNNLPIPKVGEMFIGRELALYDINTNLAKHQVINIHGEPGAGKSSLALTAAHWQLQRNLFPDGVIWHSVEHDWTLANLATTISSVLGSTESPLPPPAITAQFGFEKILLIIDNFETALDRDDAGDQSAGELIDFLAALAGSGRIITTSRRADTGLGGELPLKLDGLSPAKAAELFWGTAERLGWHGDQAPDPEAEIEKICQLLGYLPLPIKLVAPLVAKEHLGLGELYEKLCEKGRALDLLISNAKGVPRRLRDYRVSLLLSYEALDLPCKRVFAAMAVFAGDADEWGLDAVLSLVEPNTRKIVAELEDRSLIRFQHEPGKRWLLPPVMAVLANEKIKDKELAIEANALRMAHAQYYLTIARQYQLDHARWAELDDDWENIRLALNWLIDAQVDASLIINFVEYLVHVNQLRRPFEHQSWIESGLAAARGIDDANAQAFFQNVLGGTHYARGDYDTALGWYEKSVAIKEKLGDRAGLAASYNNIGEIHRARSDYETALGWYEKSVAIEEKLGDLAGLAASYNNIGLIHYARGDYDTALGWHEKSAAIREKLGDLAGLAASYHNIGLIHCAHGDYDTALGWHEKSVAIKEKLGDLAGLAASYHNIGGIHHARGDYDTALGWYEKSVAITEKLGDLAGLAASYNNIGMIHEAGSEYDTALGWHEKSAAIREKLGDLAGLVASYSNIGAALWSQKKSAEAAAYFWRSRKISAQLGAQHDVADAEQWLAGCLEKLGVTEYNAVIRKVDDGK